MVMKEACKESRFQILLLILRVSLTRGIIVCVLYLAYLVNA